MPEPFSVPVPDGFQVPIGLRLNQAARAVGRAFDEALAQAGGTLPVWLILLNLKVRRPGTQRELADAVGIREATLTHHLNAMDADGLITRTREAANRRVQVVTLTDKGDQAFLSLRAAAMAFDARLRTGLADPDLATLETLLTRLSANAAPPADPGPPAACPAAHWSRPPLAPCSPRDPHSACARHDRGDFFLCGNSACDNNTELPRS
jgi:MarR family transcriptional regulator for hemolysin